MDFILKLVVKNRSRRWYQWKVCLSWYCLSTFSKKRGVSVVVLLSALLFYQI
jgi:hypothetical protein